MSAFQLLNIKKTYIPVLSYRLFPIKAIALTNVTDEASRRKLNQSIGELTSTMGGACPVCAFRSAIPVSVSHDDSKIERS